MPEATILVIDDEPALRQSLEKMLVRAGYVVHSTSNPAEAKQTLESTSVDLAILDLVLPNWAGELTRATGLGLLKEIKREYPQVKVIMLTGRATVETAVEALRIGALDYIVKANISSRDFVAKVEEALNSNTPLPVQRRTETRTIGPESPEQTRSIKYWLTRRLPVIMDEIIASLILSILVFIFGKAFGVLEGGLANWLGSTQALWYLGGGLLAVVMLVGAYVVWQRRR